MHATLELLSVARDAALEGRADAAKELRAQVTVDFDHDEPEYDSVLGFRAVLGAYFTEAAIVRKYPRASGAMNLASFSSILKQQYPAEHINTMTMRSHPLLATLRKG